jgi:hypothetical protein
MVEINSLPERLGSGNLAEPEESFVDFLFHFAVGNLPVGKTEEKMAYPYPILAFSNLKQEDTEARTWNLILMGCGIERATLTSGGLPP